jgi:hypothetical protein
MLYSNEYDETLLAIISINSEKKKKKKNLERFFWSKTTECHTDGVHMRFIYRLDKEPLQSKQIKVMADFSSPIKE